MCAGYEPRVHRQGSHTWRIKVRSLETRIAPDCWVPELSLGQFSAPRFSSEAALAAQACILTLMSACDAVSQHRTRCGRWPAYHSDESCGGEAHRPAAQLGADVH